MWIPLSTCLGRPVLIVCVPMIVVSGESLPRLRISALLRICRVNRFYNGCSSSLKFTLTWAAAWENSSWKREPPSAPSTLCLVASAGQWFSVRPFQSEMPLVEGSHDEQMRSVGDIPVCFQIITICPPEPGRHLPVMSPKLHAANPVQIAWRWGTFGKRWFKLSWFPWF